MAASPAFFDPRNLAQFQGLELRARRIVEGYVAGQHKSPYHGFSIEFAEHREYVPGDDLRYVDWKVFGRTDKVYLKQFEEETNLIVYVLLDGSRSMTYQGPGAAMSKLEYAQTVAASLTNLVLRQQDSVGLATFDQQIRQVLPASGSPSQFNAVCRVLDQPGLAEKTAIGPIFHDLSERFKRRGIVIVLSDLFDDVNTMLAGLKHFRHRRHEVIVFQILDPAELDFPFRDPTIFKGLEAESPVVADPRGLRAAYLETFNAFLREVQTGCRSHHLDCVPLRTDQPMDVALSAYLAARGNRLRG
ncbi:MAG TPA: DUF58 domain-containing protein [Pirellulales bacterium]